MLNRLLGGLLLLCACGSAPVMELGYLDDEALTDGRPAEWKGRIQYVEEAGLSLGAARDGDALRLVLVTADPELQMQILNFGLVVWLDREGGEARDFGIQYPWTAPEDLSTIGRGTRDSDEESRRLLLKQRILALGAEFLLLGNEEGGGRLMMNGGKPGFELAMAMDGPRLVYELKIPLDGDQALNLEGDYLSLGLQTRVPERAGGPSEMAGMAGGRMGGAAGRGGRGGQSGGGMTGGPSPKPGRGRPESLDTWIRLKLPASAGSWT